MDAIHPKKGIFYTSNYSSVPVYQRPGSTWRRMPAKSETKKLKKDLLNSRHRIHVARKIVLPPGSETIVLARCADGGSFFLQPEEKILDKYRARLANGVVNFRRNRPLKVIVANFAR